MVSPTPATIQRIDHNGQPQAAPARRMKANGETAATICETLGIGRTTLYRYLAESDCDYRARW